MPCLDPITTERIERLVYQTIQENKGNFQLLQAHPCPEGQQPQDPQIPLTPIALGVPETWKTYKFTKQLEDEILLLWQLLWDQYGLAAWGFNLFHDGTYAYMTEFSMFGFRMSVGPATYIKMPIEEFDESLFFDHICFPPSAKEKLAIVSSAQ